MRGTGQARYSFDCEKLKASMALADSRATLHNLIREELPTIHPEPGLLLPTSLSLNTFRVCLCATTSTREGTPLVIERYMLLRHNEIDRGPTGWSHGRKAQAGAILTANETPV